jgi:16S rRNA (cytosine967-C5)-methyltransferase
MPITAARRAALEALGRVESERRFARDVLDELLGPLARPDRGLATALTYGVLRHRLTLDHVLRSFSRERRAPRPTELRQILRAALFQILFMDRIPPRAAIDQAVEQARAASAASAGYVNGLLRAVVGSLKPVDGRDPRAWLDRPDGRRRTFDRPIFPPPEDRVNHLALTTSHPPWLIGRWLRAFGARVTERIARADNAVPPTTLRLNPHRARAGAIHARRTSAVAEMPGYDEGTFCVQDRTAMAVAPALAAVRPRRVLDLCAGVGGKSTHLAELLGKSVPILALDRARDRLARLRRNARRLRLDSIAPVLADAARAPLRSVFEAILLDAPCTNSGVLGRRPEARWRLRASDFERCAGVQRRLLAAAASLSAPGGRILYATCSIDAAENERVVEDFLRRHGTFRLEASRLDLPASEAGGGFWAMLRRRA